MGRLAWLPLVAWAARRPAVTPAGARPRTLALAAMPAKAMAVGPSANAPGPNTRCRGTARSPRFPLGRTAFVRVWEDLGEDVTTGETIAPLLATFGNISTSDGQELFGALLFQDGDLEAGLLALFDPLATLTLSEVATDLPGTTFTPVLPSVSLSTQPESMVSGTPIQLDSLSVPISQGPADNGTYALITSVVDVFGNSNSDVQAVTLSSPIEP